MARFYKVDTSKYGKVVKDRLYEEVKVYRELGKDDKKLERFVEEFNKEDAIKMYRNTYESLLAIERLIIEKDGVAYLKENSVLDGKSIADHEKEALRKIEEESDKYVGLKEDKEELEKYIEEFNEDRLRDLYEKLVYSYEVLMGSIEENDRLKHQIIVLGDVWNESDEEREGANYTPVQKGGLTSSWVNKRLKEIERTLLNRGLLNKFLEELDEKGLRKLMTNYLNTYNTLGSLSKENKHLREVVEELGGVV